MLVLKLLNHSLGFLLPLGVFQVVHVQLVFEIVDVCVFFDVDPVETLKLRLKTFVLLLVLGLDILDTLKAFISAL